MGRPARYLLPNGDRVPSNTECLALAGHVSFDFLSAEHLERIAQEGIYIHEMVHLYEQAQLLEASLPVQYRLRLEAWKKFVEMTGWISIPEQCETPVIHERWGYGTTPDRVGRCGMSNAGGSPAVLELKRGASRPYFALQTMGQALALQHAEGGVLPYRRFSLRLGADGKPRITEYPLEDWLDDRKAFLAAVTTAHWKLARNPSLWRDLGEHPIPSGGSHVGA